MQGLGATWHFRRWGALCNLRTDHQTYLRLRGLTCRVRENAIPFWAKSYIGEACSRNWCLIAGGAGSSAGYKKLLLRVRLYGRKARGLRLNFSLDFGSPGILKEQKNLKKNFKCLLTMLFCSQQACGPGDWVARKQLDSSGKEENCSCKAPGAGPSSSFPVPLPLLTHTHLYVVLTVGWLWALRTWGNEGPEGNMTNNSHSF